MAFLCSYENSHPFYNYLHALTIHCYFYLHCILILSVLIITFFPPHESPWDLLYIQQSHLQTNPEMCTHSLMMDLLNDDCYPLYSRASSYIHPISKAHASYGCGYRLAKHITHHGHSFMNITASSHD